MRAPQTTASARQLRDWADLSVHANQEILARHPPAGREALEPRRFGGAVAYATGRPSGFFNAVVVLEPTAPDDVAAGLAWLREREESASIRVRADLDTPALAALANASGLRREPWADPAMVLHPLPPAPAAPPQLDIEDAVLGDLTRAYQAVAAGFGFPVDAPSVIEGFIPPGVLQDPAVRLFGGFVDGRPAASSLAIRSSPVVGIYAVGTAEWARRRGFATAMTRRAIEAGREWGCVAATLQASPMGEPVYRAMGFIEVARYVAYVEPRDANPGTSGDSS